MKKKENRFPRQHKPIVVLCKSDGNELIPEWKFFRRYKSKQQALLDIINRLTVSNLFIYKIKGEERTYCRGY